MKTLIATATLTIMFLSAGAFASNNRPPAVRETAVAVNVTVVGKNQTWPLAGQITVENL